VEDVKDRIALDEEHFLTYRDTPWDREVFGFQTNEILDIRCAEAGRLPDLLAKWDVSCRERGIRFAFTRVDTENRAFRKGLQENGFYYAETTFHVSRPGLDRADFSRERRNVRLEEPGDEDLAAVRDIAANDFDFGRFHEDPLIDNALARKRYYNWIDNLLRQGCECLVYRARGEVLGFHIQRIENRTAELILTGTRKSASLVSLSLWAAALEALRERGVKQAATVISASNLGVVNLYSYFGFKFDRALVGFHKFYEGN
jgi:hypothetical protein